MTTAGSSPAAPATPTPTTDARVIEHADDGRSSQHWRRLTYHARHTRQCELCPPSYWIDPDILTTHLKDDAPCYPDHSHARLEDVVVLCRRHHGATDAARAHIGTPRRH
jgi:hypothetical protein